MIPEIQTNIEPPIRNVRVEMGKAMDAMQVNDSIVVPDTISRRSYAYKVAKDKGFRVRVKAEKDLMLRIWRIT